MVEATECSCDRCSRMCRAPCCGTIEDMKALIEAGYAGRLMLDDWEGGPDMLKPAIKGSEGKRAPWSVRSERGCTFWKGGLCELHATGLKPTQGKLAHHTNGEDEREQIRDIIEADWEDKEAAEDLIEKWERLVEFTYGEDDEEEEAETSPR